MSEKQAKQFKKKWKVPYAWIQWKGTDVCMDIHCKCGNTLHADATFCYYVKCPYCKRIYECDGHIKLHELDYRPDTCIVELEKELDLSPLLDEKAELIE